MNSKDMSTKTLRGYHLVPQYDDILKVEVANTTKTMALPARYIFQATHAYETTGQMTRELEEQRQRVHTAFRADGDDRMGDKPIAMERMMRGERGEKGEKGEPGPPGAPTKFDLNPVIKEMQTRLDARDEVRHKARDKEMQDELSTIRMEAQKHAETARALAQMNANLTSIPSEIRAVAEATTQRSERDARSYLQAAVAHLDRRQQENHESHVQFLQRNGHDLAKFAGQLGKGLADAFNRFKPPERETVAVQPPPPPPPPPPPAARIKRAAEKALPPPPRPANPPDGPPSQPGSSNDPPRGGLFGPPAPPGYKKKESEYEEQARLDREHELRKASKRVAKPKQMVKTKHDKKPPAGLRQTDTVPDHKEKLTRKGPRPIAKGKEAEDDKPKDLAPKRSEVDYARGHKRKEAPAPPRVSMIRKKPMESGRVEKKRRVIVTDV